MNSMRYLVLAISILLTVCYPTFASMIIESPAFQHEQPIPKRYTCQDIDVNPSLNIAQIPDGTKSLALIVDDPDAPMGTWVHWVVYNIPLIEFIKENSIPGDQGMNDFGRKDYGGPCPPSGVHRYYFKLYALDTMLDVDGDMTKENLLEAMKGHIIEESVLMGTYIKE